MDHCTQRLKGENGIKLKTNSFLLKKKSERNHHKLPIRNSGLQSHILWGYGGEGRHQSIQRTDGGVSICIPYYKLTESYCT